MSVAEKMYLMEQLWDSLKQNEDELASPAWHETVLKERKNAMKMVNYKCFHWTN